ncbi:MAG: MAPEG family protein [Hyphomonadaceae bacterium]|nr:MAPEG family protein [Hyphomonadaceae bacterium]
MEMEAPDFSAMISTLLDGQMAEMQTFLTPVLLLVCWTLILWLWMYVTRLPAMQKAKIDPDSARHPGTYGDRLPASVRSVADNYNHLHEQPTIFYALMIFAGLTGGADTMMMYLGYAYGGIRVLHSLVQILSPKVALRFLVFSLGTIVLFVMAGKEVIRVFL